MRGVAFKVTYNDGGAAPGGIIGFRDVCSTPVMLDNVRIRQKTNCARADCACRIFVDGNFKGARPSIEGGEPWCYESTLLRVTRPWCFGAGFYHNGPKAGQPIPMQLANAGDVALLTTVAPNAFEPDRFIFAVFRIGKVEKDPDWGFKAVSDGTMEVRIPDAVAPRLKFWDFYRNRDAKIFWGTGLFRGLNADQTKSVLAVLMGELGDSDDRDLIYEVLGRNVMPRPRTVAGRGGTGEGEAHRRLKARVAANPTLIGLPITATARTEHEFTSGDRVDVVFDLPDGRSTVVEIETIVTLPGAHQCVKYRALQEAGTGDNLNSGRVEAVLVAYDFDEQTRRFAERYGIRLVVLPP